MEKCWVPPGASKLSEVNGYKSLFNFWKAQKNLVDPSGLLTSTTELAQGEPEGCVTLRSNMCFPVVSFWTCGALYGCSLIGAWPSVNTALNQVSATKLVGTEGKDVPVLVEKGWELAGLACVWNWWGQLAWKLLDDWKTFWTRFPHH